ncbi:hypothetical protein ENBRE01_2735 [Enteropsectra breve]|nr:hypothetical protein ENBRE01_2735 [Enteropsectra breve]
MTPYEALTNPQDPGLQSNNSKAGKYASEFHKLHRKLFKLRDSVGIKITELEATDKLRPRYTEGRVVHTLCGNDSY